MKAGQKLLLILAVAGSTIGITVSLSRVRLDPAWTVALPGGVVCLGLFLISRLLQNEVARFDDEQRSKIESARCNLASAPAKNGKLADHRADQLLPVARDNEGAFPAQ